MAEISDKRHIARAVISGLIVAGIVGAVVIWRTDDGISNSWHWLGQSSSVANWWQIISWGMFVCLLVLLIRNRLNNKKPIYYSDDDCVAQLIHFIGNQTDGIGGEALDYKELDKQLRLVPGATKRHIQTAAMHYRYSARVKGDQSIVFEHL